MLQHAPHGDRGAKSQAPLVLGLAATITTRRPAENGPSRRAKRKGLRGSNSTLRNYPSQADTNSPLWGWLLYLGDRQHSKRLRPRNQPGNRRRSARSHPWPNDQADSSRPSCCSHWDSHLFWARDEWAVLPPSMVMTDRASHNPAGAAGQGTKNLASHTSHQGNKEDKPMATKPRRLKRVRRPILLLN